MRLYTILETQINTDFFGLFRSERKHHLVFVPGTITSKKLPNLGGFSYWCCNRCCNARNFWSCNRKEMPRPKSGQPARYEPVRHGKKRSKNPCQDGATICRIRPFRFEDLCHRAKRVCTVFPIADDNRQLHRTHHKIGTHRS